MAEENERKKRLAPLQLPPDLERTHQKRRKAALHRRIIGVLGVLLRLLQFGIDTFETRPSKNRR